MLSTAELLALSLIIWGLRKKEKYPCAILGTPLGNCCWNTSVFFSSMLIWTHISWPWISQVNFVCWHVVARYIYIFWIIFSYVWKSIAFFLPSWLIFLLLEDIFILRLVCTRLLSITNQVMSLGPLSCPTRFRVLSSLLLVTWKFLREPSSFI